MVIHTVTHASTMSETKKSRRSRTLQRSRHSSAVSVSMSSVSWRAVIYIHRHKLYISLLSSCMPYGECSLYRGFFAATFPYNITAGKPCMRQISWYYCYISQEVMFQPAFVRFVCQQLHVKSTDRNFLPQRSRYSYSRRQSVGVRPLQLILFSGQVINYKHRGRMRLPCCFLPAVGHHCLQMILLGDRCEYSGQGYCAGRGSRPGIESRPLKRSLKTFMFGHLGRGALCLNVKGAECADQKSSYLLTQSRSQVRRSTYSSATPPVGHAWNFLWTRMSPLNVVSHPDPYLCK